MVAGGQEVATHHASQAGAIGAVETSLLRALHAGRQCLVVEERRQTLNTGRRVAGHTVIRTLLTGCRVHEIEPGRTVKACSGASGLLAIFTVADVGLAVGTGVRAEEAEPRHATEACGRGSDTGLARLRTLRARGLGVQVVSLATVGTGSSRGTVHTVRQAGLADALDCHEARITGRTHCG